MISNANVEFLGNGLPDSLGSFCPDSIALSSDFNLDSTDNSWPNRDSTSISPYWTTSDEDEVEGAVGDWDGIPQPETSLSPSDAVDELLRQTTDDLSNDQLGYLYSCDSPTILTNPLDAFTGCDHSVSMISDMDLPIAAITNPVAVVSLRQQCLDGTISSSATTACTHPPTLTLRRFTSPFDSSSESGADASQSVSPRESPSPSPSMYMHGTMSGNRSRIKGASVDPKHAAGRNHVCHECSARFLCKSKLNRHMLTHSGAKPFPCFCGKRFNQKSSLKNHTRRHIKKRNMPKDINLEVQGLNGFTLQCLK
jgi:hypothetical protein